MHIVKLSYFLYFFLLLVLIAFLVVFYQSQDTAIHSNLLWLISLLLFPVYDKIYAIFEGDIGTYKPQSLGDLLITLGIPLVLILLYIGGIINFIGALGLFSLYAVIKKVDVRLFFSIALIFFFYVGIYLLVGQEKQVANLSIMAYYILIAGVGVHLLQSVKK